MRELTAEEANGFLESDDAFERGEAVWRELFFEDGQTEGWDQDIAGGPEAVRRFQRTFEIEDRDILDQLSVRLHRLVQVRPTFVYDDVGTFTFYHHYVPHQDPDRPDILVIFFAIGPTPATLAAFRQALNLIKDPSLSNEELVERMEREMPVIPERRRFPAD